MQNAVVGMKYFFYAVPVVKADIKYCIYKKKHHIYRFTDRERPYSVYTATRDETIIAVIFGLRIKPELYFFSFQRVN